jgi:integrase
LEFVHFGAIRHSFATWLVERGSTYNPKGGGLPLKAVAQALNHSSTRTTALHYVSATVPPMYVVPIRLEHPQDPATLCTAQPQAS